MHCKKCGAKMIELKTPTSWESRYRCDKCGLRCQVCYGDAMGGSSDVITYHRKPFTSEQPI